MKFVKPFKEVMTTNAGKVSCVETIADAIPLLDAFTREHKLEKRIRISPALRPDWPPTPEYEVESGTTDGNDLICASCAFAAVADTGTLVLRSGPHNPTRLNFLSDYHLVFVAADRIIENKKALWPLLETMPEMPRTLHFISGPSRTADIEQTIQLGAHGPRLLWVFITGMKPDSVS